MATLPIAACLSNVTIEHVEAHMAHLPGSVDIQVQVKCHESGGGGLEEALARGIRLVLTLTIKVNDSDAGDEAARFEVALSGMVSDLGATVSEAGAAASPLSFEEMAQLRSLGLDALYGQAVAQTMTLANGMGLNGLPLPIITPGTLQSSLTSR